MMGTIHIFMFTFFIVQVFCEQKNSLTFVIDDTSSMYDEIYQVKSAAKSIVDIVLNEKASQIQDIVVVTFNDPSFKFRHRTRNEVELKHVLDNISIYGGGDCPEQSLSGIELALGESQPGSYLFVFTDASAKDYRKFNDIKELCQEKQSQIVFVLTGGCGDWAAEANQVYYKIAAASNGQVFRISKGEVGQVLEYVKETIKGDKTVITSRVVPPYTWSTVHFNIDDKTEYALVSASGSNVQLTVSDQYGRDVSGIAVIWTQNVKALKLVKLRPGAYKAKVRGSSDVNVMVFGRTDFNFKFGFSDNVQNSLKNTEAQPTEDIETRLIISVKDDEHSVNIENVEILDMKENVIKLLPLKHVEGNVYATEKFLSPNSMFKVAVTAKARSTGKPIRRIANTPVEPIKPVMVAPEISDTEKLLKAKEGETVDVHCRILKGKPKPHVTWYYEQRGDYLVMPGKTDEVLRISNVEVGNSGKYKCVAENTVGRASHIVTLEVYGLPAFEKSPSVLEVKQSANVDIPCKIVKGNPMPAITWQFKSSEGEFHDIENIGEHLRIVNVQLRNSGFYKCRAENSIGVSEKVTQVVVLGPPAFGNSPSLHEVRQSANLDIQCQVIKGQPILPITWQFRSSEGEFHDLENVGEHLRIVNVQLRNSGFYKCRAENSIGASEKVTEVVVLVNPDFEETPAEITVMVDAPVTIKCKLREGNPPPTITWYFQSIFTPEFTALRNNGDELTLPAAHLGDSGVYRCVAENKAGRDEKTTRVTVLSAPVIERSEPSVKKVKENATIVIDCVVSKGFPTPTITWLNQDGESMDYAAVYLRRANRGKVLRLRNIQLSQAGHYKCVAQNSVGTANKDVQIIVEAPARIVFIPPNSPFYEGVEGDLVMRLPCTAVGYPEPIVSWIVDNDVVGKDKSRPMYVEDGVLYLKNPDESHSSNYSHTYVCYANNSFGDDKQSYNVVVSKYADYNNTGEIYGEIGKPYDLKCPLPYTDPNSVRWFYNSIYINKTGPSLYFEDASQENNGNYTCRVSDLKGATSYTIELKFGRPPWSPRLSYNEDWNGELTDILCKAQQIIPDGKYEWFYQGEKIKEADAHELEVTLIGWGQYVCRVTNPLGSLNITYNIHATDCIIGKSSSRTKNPPLVLDVSLTWPRLFMQQQYQIIPTSKELTLICQDESPKNESNSTTNSNSFTKLPNTKSIIATCDHEDIFLVDGVSYKFSELDCKEELQSSVVAEKECLGNDTMMMNVGFNVNGFLSVYKSCMDTKRNVVLYTELITTSQYEYDDSAETPSAKSCENVADCCYESAQLVNPTDVSTGPAETATLRKPLNTVSYCRPNNDTFTSWHDIEQKVRVESSRSSLMVWSGAVNYTTVDELLVPQYLWKVVKDLDNGEIIAIVHSNEQKPSTSLCESVCEESSWFEPYGPRTYCCRLDEFRRMFNLPINF